MAKNFLSGLRLVKIASDPVSGSEGELYYNTVTDKVRIFSDGAWRDLSASTSGSLVNIDSIQYPDYIAFDTTPESTSASVGTLAWDSGEGGLGLQINSNIQVTIGQEIIVLANNGEATTLNKGEVVRLTGASGQRPKVMRAYNTADAGSAVTFGIVAENILSGAEGFIVTQGVVKNINTNAYNEGDILYLSDTPGQVTTTKPQAPNHYVFVGVVTKKNASSGRIYVKPQNGYELNEIHDVRINGVANDDLIIYNSASSIWVNSPSQNIINTASAAAYASASAYTNSSLVPYLTQSSASSSYVAQNATGNEYIQDQAAVLFNHALHVNASATYDDANNRVIITANAGGGGGGATVAYQTTQPDTATLPSGSLWIDSDQDAISGLLPATFTRWVKVLSASATTISGLDDNSLSLLYVPGYEKVFINGTLLVRGSDYTATTGNTIVLPIAAEINDVIEIHAYEAFQIANTYTQAQIDSRFNNYTRWSETYSASAATITGVDDYLNALNYTSGYERVFVNGVLLHPSEYTRTSASVITPLEPILAGDVVEVFNIVSAQVGDTYTTAQIDAKYNNRTRWTKTYSASATVVSGADDNAITLSYTSGNEEVYLNGILLTPVTDYARTSASVITLGAAVVSGDIIDVVNISPFNVANVYSQTQIDAKYNDYTRWTKTLSASATTISGNDNNSLPLSYTPGKEQVYVNGSLIMRGTEYTASSGSTIVLNEAAVVDDVIDVVSITPFNIANVYTQTQVDSKVGTNGGMVLINKTDFSVVSSTSINNCFSSTYQNYKMVLAITAATGNANLYIRWRSSSGDLSDASYERAGFKNYTSGATITAMNQTGQDKWIFSGTLAAAGDRGGGTFEVQKPFDSSATIATYVGSNQDGGGLGHWSNSVIYTPSTSITGFSLIGDAGAFTGTIRVYGYRNDI